jgi:threonyl-tRNA synthetase
VVAHDRRAAAQGGGGGEVDGEVQDLVTPLRRGGAFRVLTERDPEALAVLRHSGAHVLATAVRRLRPDAKIGFGPAIEDGFYYDFEVAEPFTPEDLAAFEAEMRKVAQEKLRSSARGLARRGARGLQATTRSSSSASRTCPRTR